MYLVLILAALTIFVWVVIYEDKRQTEYWSRFQEDLERLECAGQEPATGSC